MPKNDQSTYHRALTASNFMTAFFHGVVAVALAAAVWGGALYALRQGARAELLLLVVALWGGTHGYYMREHTQAEYKMDSVPSLFPWNWNWASILDYLFPLIAAVIVFFLVKLFLE